MYRSRYYVVLLMYTSLCAKKYFNYNVIFQRTMRRRRGRYGEKTFLIFRGETLKVRVKKNAEKGNYQQILSKVLCYLCILYISSIYSV